MLPTKHAKSVALVLCAIIAIVLIISFKANPSLFNQKNVGSFEYIRIGERLADKGKYSEAIGYFEKAFEASPESDIIRANLVWIYTIYANELSSAGSISRAIYFFNKAYELKQNPATAQNLAVAYVKKAIEDLRRGDWVKGIDFCTKAREITAESCRASENLGIHLYNEAQNEFKAGRDTIAILLLSESFLSSESKYPFRLLGDIYYRRTDLAQAAFYWGRALELDPENKELAEHVSRVYKEMEMERKQQKFEMRHFELRYDPKLQFDVAALHEAMDKAYLKAGKKMAYFPKDKTVVFLYSEKDFKGLFKLSPAVRAFYDGNIRMPLPQGPLAGDELTQFIEHEYTHAVISAMTENNCPPWLGEGIAVSIQIDKDDPRIKEALLKIGDISKISIDSIDAIFKDQTKEKADLGPYYSLAYTVVQYINDTFGVEALRGILKRMRSGQHFVNAMDDQLLISEKEFEKRWHAYVAKKMGG